MIFKRANRLISESSDLVHNADETVKRLGQLAEAVIQDLKDAVAEASDGVTLTLQKKGENSLFDFFMGKCNTLPVSVVVTLNEPEDQKSS